MTNPSVGSLQLFTLQGTEPADPAMRLKEITREGINGHAYSEIGKRGVVTQMTGTVDVTNVSTLRAAVGALISTLVTVTLSDGGTVEQVMVLDARIASCQKVGFAVGGLTAGSWWVMVHFTLQGTKVL